MNICITIVTIMNLQNDGALSLSLSQSATTKKHVSHHSNSIKLEFRLKMQVYRWNKRHIHIEYIYHEYLTLFGKT